eukprot:TRINITY_DN1874_c0_g1_i4.p1 TRINITY_DN1874_c0_g1~~TRINITY_DN1874_c0_g1_i4.p1  ORF type:complete len:1115 (+),score=149.97 TRINITY_DN1874_c0_g1_i4:53-3397(+)
MSFVYGFSRTVDATLFRSTQRTNAKNVPTLSYERPFAIESDGRIVSVAASPNGKMVAVISLHVLYIWSSTQQNILLCKHSRTKTSIAEHGPNHRIIWRHDDAALVIMTLSGALIYVSITVAGKVDVHLGMSQATIYDLTPLQRLKSHQLNARTVVEVPSKDAKAQSIHRMRQALLVVTSDNHLRVLSWIDLTVLQQISMAEILQEGESSAITSLSYDRRIGIMAVVFESGRAGLVYLKNDPSMSASEYLSGAVGKVLPVSGSASCVAVNHKFCLVAVGYAKGVVDLISFPESADHEEFSVKKLEVSSEVLATDPGAVVSTSWSGDGTSLVVGWDKGGFVVFNASGCRTFSSFTQSFTSSEVDIFYNGILCTAWTAGGHQLVVVPEQSSTAGIMIIYSLIRTHHQKDGSHIFLYGDSCLYYVNPTGISSGNLSLQQVQVPEEYLAFNWPIRTISLSPDGSMVAVIGSKGFALHLIARGKWRLFGNQLQEKSISVISMFWAKRIILVYLHNTLRGCYEILLLSPDYLDLSHVLGKISFERKPSALTVERDMLIAYMPDHWIHFYHINTLESRGNHIPRVCVDIVSEVFIQSSLAPPSSIVAIPYSEEDVTTELVASLPSHISTREKFIKYPVALPCHLLLTRSGCRATILDIRTQTEKQLSNSVESIILPPVSWRDRMSYSFWLYNASGCQNVFSVPLLTDKESPLPRGSALPFDPEVYPAGILPELGIIVAFTQGIAYPCGAASPFHDIQPRAHPFLNSILRMYLSNNQIEKAYQIAQKWSTSMQFSHSLELLLHEALEEQTLSIARSIPEDSSLHRAVRLLKQFPQFPDIVVHCTRKTDISHWGHIFKCVGSPKALYERCLLSRPLSTAASYLIILRNVEGQIVTNRCAVRLLESSLQQHEYQLARDILRFLNALDGQERFTRYEVVTAPKKPVSKIEEIVARRGSRPLLPPVPKGSNIDGMAHEDLLFAVESVLRTHAKLLLRQCRLVELTEFGRKTNTLIRPLIQKESCPVCSASEFEDSMESLHEQTMIYYPDSLNGNHWAAALILDTAGLLRDYFRSFRSVKLSQYFNALCGFRMRLFFFFYAYASSLTLIFHNLMISCHCFLYSLHRFC